MAEDPKQNENFDQPGSGVSPDRIEVPIDKRQIRDRRRGFDRRSPKDRRNSNDRRRENR